MTDSQAETKTLLSRLRRLALRWLVFYGIIVLVLALLQRKLMYHPTVVDALPVPETPPGQNVTPVTTDTADGLTLHGWHWHLTEPGERPVVLFFHGNGGNRTHRTWDCELFAKCGADTVIFDYRGYAENPGKPTEEGLHQDGRAAWNYVTRELGIPPERIYIFGGSLGGGVAVPLAAALCAEGTPPAGLMLRATFSSMVEAASFNYPWLPVRWILIDRYPSIDHADKVTCPILQMHGDADEIVPFEFGRKLFDAFPDASANGRPKSFVELPGAGHNNILQTNGEAVLQSTQEFLASQ